MIEKRSKQVQNKQECNIWYKNFLLYTYGEGYRRNYEDSDIVMGEIIIKIFNMILIIIMGILIQYLELITHVKLTLIGASECAKSQLLALNDSNFEIMYLAYYFIKILDFR